MFNFKNLFFVLLCSAIFTGFVTAQPPPPASAKNSSNNSRNEQSFVSLDGGFTIALPQQINSFTGITPKEGVNKGGSQFAWKTPQGYFLIAYVDRVLSSEEHKQFLQILAEGLVKKLNNEGAKLISNNEIRSNNYLGVEIRMQSKSNEIGILRYILVENRLFILTAGWKDGEDGKAQIATLDTFKLLDRKSAIAKKVEEATPSLLPLSSIIKKLKTDAEDDGLKGKVKSVTETEEDLTGSWSVTGVKMSSEDFYDENGNQLKNISYDYRGNPSSVVIYGFTDGRRVSKSGYVNYEYNPPLPAMPPPPPPSAKPSGNTEVSKPADTIYSVGYEYKYDDKGQLQEVVRYNNKGAMTSRTVYSRDGNKLEETSFDKDGKINYKTIELFDEKGNLIGKIFDHSNSKYANSEYKYTYQSFDEKGNWTKRTVSAKEGQYNGGFKDQSYVKYRTIIYYQ